MNNVAMNRKNQPKGQRVKLVHSSWKHLNFYMENLDCAICGDKIAHLFMEKPGVLDAGYSLATGILWAHVEETHIKGIELVLQEVAREVDNYVTVRLEGQEKKPGWKLEGLTCANCAGKIIDTLNHMDEVNYASFSLATEKLDLSLAPGVDPEEFQGTLQALVDRMEPGVVARYEGGGKELHWKIRGLSCENCAGKIIREIRGLPQVNEAEFSLATEGLYLRIKHSADEKRLMTIIQDITDRIEPGCVVEGEISRSQEAGGSSKNRAFYISVGGGLLAALLGKFLVPPGLLQRLIFALGLVVAGGTVYRQAFRNIKRGDIFDENFLMTIATLGAFFVGEYLEALAVMVFYQVGEFLQEKAVNSSRRSISSLLSLKAEVASVLRGGEYVEVSPEEVHVGETISVRPGEKIPLDGIILEGESFVDTSNITGESVPRRMVAGDEVHSGCLNGEGLLILKVTRDYGDGTVSRILQMVENAASKKSKIEAFITKFARIYTPVVVAIAVFLAVAMPFITHSGFSEWIYEACIFLILSCPCALVISVPLGVFGGVGAASKEGVFVKGGNYLEALADVSVVAFDKTGTITRGVYEVDKVEGLGVDEEELLAVVAAGEAYSTHPIARAIVKRGGSGKGEVSNYREIPGRGISYTLDGRDILAGNAVLLREEGLQFEETSEVGTVIYVAAEGKYLGYILVRDTLKPQVQEHLKELHDMGVKTVLLSGDDDGVARAVAKEAGIDLAYGNLLPEDKVNRLEGFMDSETRVAFVGDGVNDAPVLARADVGIAMGKLGSDAAVETADVILMNDEISSLVKAFKVSKRTRVIVLENIIFALGVKILVLILGLFGVATMWEAVFADVGVTVLAVFNSMRVLKRK